MINIIFSSFIVIVKIQFEQSTAFYIIVLVSILEVKHRTMIMIA